MLSLAIQPLICLGLINLDIEFSILNGVLVIKPWRQFLFTTSVIPLICFFMVLTLPESPGFLCFKGKYVEAINILKDMHRTNYKKSNSHKVILQNYKQQKIKQS